MFRVAEDVVDVLPNGYHVVHGLALLVVHNLHKSVNHLAHRLWIQSVVHIPEVVPLWSELLLHIFVVREVHGDLREQTLGSLVDLLQGNVVHARNEDASELVAPDELR